MVRTRTMNLLAIETATDACSVALDCDGRCSGRHEIAPRRHGDLILPMIDAVLTEHGLARADIDAVAYGCGPGTFTGVRIAATLTQGIASARGLPVIAISSLQALALGASRRSGATDILVATDARRREVYFCACRVHSETRALEVIVDDCLLAPGAVGVPARGDWICAGNGWEEYATELLPDVAALPRVAVPHPDALDVATLARAALAAGNTRSAAGAVPRYWRDAVD